MGLCQNSMNKTGVEDPHSLTMQVTAKDHPNQVGDNKENIINIDNPKDGSICNSKNPTNINNSVNTPDNIDSKNQTSSKDDTEKDVGKCQSEIFAQEHGTNKDQEVNDIQIPLNAHFKSDKEINLHSQDDPVKIEETPNVRSEIDEKTAIESPEKCNNELQDENNNVGTPKKSFKFEDSDEENICASPEKERKGDENFSFANNQELNLDPPSPDKAEKKNLPTEENTVENCGLTEPPSPDMVEKKYLAGYKEDVAPIPRSNIALKDIDSQYKLTQEGDYTTGIKQALNLESKVQRLEQEKIIEESEHNTPVISKKSLSIKNNSSIMASKHTIKDSPSKNNVLDTDDVGITNPSMLKNDSKIQNNSLIMKSQKFENNSSVMKNESKVKGSPQRNNIDFLGVENLETNENVQENEERDVIVEDEKENIENDRSPLLVQENQEKVEQKPESVEEKAESVEEEVSEPEPIIECDNEEPIEEKTKAVQIIDEDFKPEKIKTEPCDVSQINNQPFDAIPLRSEPNEVEKNNGLTESFAKELKEEVVENHQEEKNQKEDTIINNESQTLGFSESKVDGYIQGHFDNAINEKHFDNAINENKSKITTNKDDNKAVDPLEITINDKSANNILDEPTNTDQIQKNNEVDPEATFHSQPTQGVENTFRANPIEENAESNQNEVMENGSIEVQGSTERVRDLGSINGSQHIIEKDDDKKSVGDEPVKKITSEKKISSQKEILDLEKNEENLQNTVD